MDSSKSSIPGSKADESEHENRSDNENLLHNYDSSPAGEHSTPDISQAPSMHASSSTDSSSKNIIKQ